MSLPASRPSELHIRTIDSLAVSGVMEDCRRLDGGSADLWWKKHDIVVAVGGVIRVDGRQVRLRLGLPRQFPNYLPEIAVDRDDASLMQLPHVDDDGKLCYASDSDVLIDRRDPLGVATESLDRAARTLCDSLAGDRAPEFAREIAAYWHRLARRTIDCIVAAGDRPHSALALRAAGKLCAVADAPDAYAAVLPRRSTAKLTQENAAYVPIDFTQDPSFQPKDMMSLGGLRRHLAATSSDLAHLLRKCDKKEELVVLGIKRPQGDRTLIGVLLRRGAKGAHPLVDPHATASVEAVELHRCDREFVAPRGGANADLSNRRILLAGCGSVGGHVAVALARAGVGHLTLVDHDVFTMENTYRHVCGMAYRGHYKADSLKVEIERLVPHITVEACHRRVEELIAQKPGLLVDHHLLVSALGNPTTELHLNEQIWSAPANPSALFAWVEPYGLGGHVLATHAAPSAASPGCLECLICRPVEGGHLVNRAAYADPEGIYTRDVLGCGSRFLPFTDLDAMRTAELAARLAVRVLVREAGGPVLQSWRGDSQAFEAAGHKLTDRFKHCKGDGPSSDFARHDCPVCAR